MRFERRSAPSRVLQLGAPLLAVIATLLFGTLLVYIAGAPIGEAYQHLLNSAFGSRFAWSETLTRATPLILTGLAAAIAFRARLYNIGGEGQLYAGALAAAAIGGMGATDPFLPMPVLFAVMMLGAALAGALLMLGPALMKSGFGVDEVVTTLLINFIVLLFVSMMLDGPMKDPLAMGWPQSAALHSELELSRLIPRTRLHSGLLIAIALAVIAWLVIRFTRWGYEIRAVGLNSRAARFAGVRVNRVTVFVALASGALAGLAGAIEVAGRTSYVTLDMSPGYGYAGIVIAMLAALNPLAVVFSAIFVAGMQVGADGMSRAVGVPTFIADVIVAASLLLMLIAAMFSQYRLRRG